MDNPSLKTRKRSAISPQWAHWRSVVEQWKDSGENPEEFCAHRSIVFSKFRWWRGHIEKQGGRAETRVATKAEPAFVPRSVSQRGVAFPALRVPGERANASDVPANQPVRGAVHRTVT